MDLLRVKPMYVTPDEFLNFSGIDLSEELTDNGTAVDSDKASRFLLRVERRLMSYVDANTFRNYDWEEILMHENDLKAMKLAVLEQALYMFRNGDISSDSGYDPQRGSVISKNDLASREISDVALDYLKTAGLYNHVMTNRRRYARLV